jgi:hypothetical protein
VNKDGSGLAAAKASMRADQVLEGRDFLAGGIVPTQEHEVADVQATIKRMEIRSGLWPEHREWVFAVTTNRTIGREHSPPIGTEDDQRAGRSRPNHHRTDKRVLRQPFDQAGIERIDLLTTGAPRHGAQIHVREASRSGDHHSGLVHRSHRGVRARWTHGDLRVWGCSRVCSRHGSGRCSFGPGDTREQEVCRSPALGRHRIGADLYSLRRVGPRHDVDGQLSDDLLEGQTGELSKGGALGLAVV